MTRFQSPSAPPVILSGEAAKNLAPHPSPLPKGEGVSPSAQHDNGLERPRARPGRPGNIRHAVRDIPEAFLERIRPLLGPEFPEFRDALGEPSPTGLRVNPLKITPEAFQALTGWRLEPIPWSPVGFYLQEPDARPGKHPYHVAGLYYLQEPSAMAVVEAMSPEPDERILDLCAAPGGKATHIAARLHGHGLLVANDIVRPRATILADNLARFGARNAVVASDAPERLAAILPAFFHRVLVDAPCSEEGMFRRSAEARQAWSPKTVAGCARRQLRILDSAAEMVTGGGTLVYSTCTFSPEENEDVIAHFLLSHPNYELAPVRLPGVQGEGRGDWCSLPEGRRLPLERAIRLWPHRVAGDGHFVAVMRRMDEPPTVARPPHWAEDAAAAQAWRDFSDASLAHVPDGAAIRLGDRVFLADRACPTLPAVRVPWPGWHVGEMRGGRFVPSHALAMGLRLTDARQHLSLSAASDEIHAYLRGESLKAPGEPGWVLVGVDGFPIGWGFRVGDTLKNHYPRHLRQRL